MAMNQVWTVAQGVMNLFTDRTLSRLRWYWPSQKQKWRVALLTDSKQEGKWQEVLDKQPPTHFISLNMDSSS